MKKALSTSDCAACILSNSAADHMVCFTEVVDCAFAPDRVNTSGLCCIKYDGA